MLKKWENEKYINWIGSRIPAWFICIFSHLRLFLLCLLYAVIVEVEIKYEYK